MEVRPNSHPERTGPYMTCSKVDSSLSAHCLVDIPPDTTPECCIERLITKRTQRLKDDRENLKYRLHSYIALGAIKKWTPQDTLHSTSSILDLNLSSHGGDGRTCLHQSLWLRTAFLRRYVQFYLTFNTSTIFPIFHVLLISHFSLYRAFRWVFVLSLRGRATWLAPGRYCFWGTCSLVT